MSMNLVIFLYFIVLVCFIQVLKGLLYLIILCCGNFFGMVGMVIVVVIIVGLVFKLGVEIVIIGVGYIVVGLLVGGIVGLIMVKCVEMIKMFELVVFMYSMIGLVVVFIVIVVVVELQLLGIVVYLGDIIFIGNCLELFFGVVIGVIIFFGLVIVFGKFFGKYKFCLFQGILVQFFGQYLLNLVFGLVIFGLGLVFMFIGNFIVFVVMLVLVFVFGVLIIIFIGGVDMLVVVLMFNFYFGWVVVGIGFLLNNLMLIIVGLLVGFLGVIFFYIMCKVMNCLFFNVIFGGFGVEVDVGGLVGFKEQCLVKFGLVDDVLFLLINVDSVIIVFGYGLVVVCVQYVLMELVEKLIYCGVIVKFVIYLVVGCMLGYMNVLLVEVEVFYEQVFEMEDINFEFGQIDVVLVFGVNDVVNLVVKNDLKLFIVGMLIFEVYKVKIVIVNKCFMVSGYVGLDNELFYLDKIMMVFGDVKKVIEDMVKVVE